MAHYEVISAEYVPLITVKNVLNKRKKENEAKGAKGDNALTYEQLMAFKNAKENVEISESKANKLIKALRSLELRKLKDEYIMKIVDFMPSTKEELILILNTSKISFKDDEVEQILSVIKEHAK